MGNFVNTINRKEDNRKNSIMYSFTTIVFCNQSGDGISCLDEFLCRCFHKHVDIFVGLDSIGKQRTRVEVALFPVIGMGRERVHEDGKHISTILVDGAEVNPLILQPLHHEGGVVDKFGGKTGICPPVVEVHEIIEGILGSAI